MTDTAVLPVATALYAGLLGLMLLMLSYLVSRQRLSKKVSLGDGGHKELAGVIRAHANFTEYVPLALVLILMTELSGQGVWQVHALGIALVLGRGLHAYGLSTHPGGKSFGRMSGTMLTWLVILIGSLNLIVWSFYRVGSA
ncbi:MAPEG family protein [Aerophototrophica crusticola]